jgi:hypothetical protein
MNEALSFVVDLAMLGVSIAFVLFARRSWP